ncbi:NAD(P)-binding domain-containing protein [Boseaceae bacterium BT-24-1]|nr:NAD(P)-binding domain-containing protein [Boseaceae bacterium BT-24-1]
MSDVSVIGLGEMGAALAGAFLSAGKSVTVWNRTAVKAAPLQERGAILAASPAEAVGASPVVVICVSDYAATSAILTTEGVTEALAGRLVVQLTSGIPKEARALETQVHIAGARYLDGAIAAWPRQIGGPEAAIVVAGPDAVFAEARPLLKALAGEASHAGVEIGQALVLFNAALAYLAGHWIGFSHGAAICEAEGVPVDAFGAMMASLSPSLGQDLSHMGKAIATGRFEKPESTLRTAGTDIARLVELSTDLNIGAAWPRFAASVFQRGIDAGLGEEEHCAVVKVLRMA